MDKSKVGSNKRGGLKEAILEELRIEPLSVGGLAVRLDEEPENLQPLIDELICYRDIELGCDGNCYCR